MNICHKSSLISDYFAVNWTLFPNFDKNIECTLECSSMEWPMGVKGNVSAHMPSPQGGSTSRSSRLFISVGELRVRSVRYKSLLIAMKDFISTYDTSWLVFT